MIRKIESGAAAAADRTGVVRSRWTDLRLEIIRPLTTLAEARADRDGAVALVGGIVCYLTCPAGMAACHETALNRLLADLHALRFGDDEPRPAVAFLRLCPPARVWCDCDCCFGHYTGDLWLNACFAPFRIEPAAREVLRGRAAKLPWCTETLLKRAQAAQPDTPKWSQRLLSLYLARMKPLAGEERIATAALALAECENVCRVDPAGVPPVAAEVALEAGAYAAADAFARRLLRDAWRRISTSSNYYAPLYGRRVHQAHSVLGRIALRAGDTAAAEAHLIEAARTPLVLDEGETPDFTLARELLAAGERRELPRFLELCRYLWKRDGGRLARWIAELNSGGTPAIPGAEGQPGSCIETSK
jgi:hypothetical protein